MEKDISIRLILRNLYMRRDLHIPSYSLARNDYMVTIPSSL